MTYRVVILPKAESDIERNSRWWAEKHSKEQARVWFDAIHDQLQSLAHFPESNGLSTETDLFPIEIRDKLLGLGSRPSYRAVFTIRNDAVFVLTVRRSSQGPLTADQVDDLP